jgi:5-methylcytosine-specific restriction endonuclease McrA
MGTISKRTKKNLQGQQYHWKFQSVVKDLLDENPECFICGAKENLDIHHIRQCKSYNEDFYNPNNIVVICHEHHLEYHHTYPENVNVKTLLEYTRDVNLKKLHNQRKIQSNYDKMRIRALNQEKELEHLTEENMRLKQELNKHQDNGGLI